MRRAPITIPDAVVTRPTTFAVGDHTLVLAMAMEGRWTVTVDARPLSGSYDTEADAWEAGVRDAHRLDLAKGA
jgi:hypothetical protein